MCEAALFCKCCECLWRDLWPIVGYKGLRISMRCKSLLHSMNNSLRRCDPELSHLYVSGEEVHDEQVGLVCPLKQVYSNLLPGPVGDLGLYEGVSVLCSVSLTHFTSYCLSNLCRDTWSPYICMSSGMAFGDRVVTFMEFVHYFPSECLRDDCPLPFHQKVSSEIQLCSDLPVGCNPWTQSVSLWPCCLTVARHHPISLLCFSFSSVCWASLISASLVSVAGSEDTTASTNTWTSFSSCRSSADGVSFSGALDNVSALMRFLPDMWTML